jgi:CDP-paratose synthetase
MTSERRPVVLLTGATGFLGSHLLRALLESQAMVIALGRPESNWRRVRDVLPLIVRRDLANLGQAFRDFSVDVVIHTATAYGRKGETEGQVRKANVDFPLALLRAASARGVSTFFNTDSFSARAELSLEEATPYVRTKREFRERATEAVRGTACRFLNLRLEHVYGPDDNPDKFFSMLMRSFLAGQPVLELTPCEQRWDCVYVDDVVTAFTTLLASSPLLQSTRYDVQVGTGKSIVLREVVERIHALCGSKTELHFGARPAWRGTIMESHADTTTLNELGWSARIGLEEGLERMINAVRNLADKTSGRNDSLPNASTAL